MISYSVHKITNPVTNKLSVFALPQVRQTLDINDFAEHITDHGCLYDKGDVISIITKVVNCLREQILAGNKVELGDLGSFSPQLHSTGWNRGLTPDDDGYRTPDQFNAGDIDVVSIIWEKGDKVVNLRPEAQFEQVLTRKDQSAAMRENKTNLGPNPGGDGNLNL